jgi:hypothetical protein
MAGIAFVSGKQTRKNNVLANLFNSPPRSKSQTKKQRPPRYPDVCEFFIAGMMAKMGSQEKVDVDAFLESEEVKYALDSGLTQEEMMAALKKMKIVKGDEIVILEITKKQIKKIFTKAIVDEIMKKMARS